MAEKNTPKKKKTMVSLPGSLKSLVHTVQSGETSTAKVAAQQEPATPKSNEGVGENSPQQVAEQQATASVATKNAAGVGESKPQPAAEQPAAQPAEKSPAQHKEAKQPARTITKNAGDDSWDLFLDLAREYKEKDSHLATIYIDRDLKTVLDRLRASRDVRLPTTAILSAIVARFIYDNEQRIKDAIYGDRLI